METLRNLLRPNNSPFGELGNAITDLRTELRDTLDEGDDAIRGIADELGVDLEKTPLSELSHFISRQLDGISSFLRGLESFADSMERRVSRLRDRITDMLRV